jgi:hypothetical protein
MLVACLAVLLQNDPAEALYGKMALALMDSDTLRVEFKTDAKAKGAVIRSADGQMLIQAPNFLSIKSEGKAQGKVESVLTVCDGVSMKVGDRPAQPANEGAAKNHRGMLLIMGLSGYWHTKALKGVEPKTADFKLGKKETIRGLQAQALEYTLDVGNPALKISTTVWVDLNTHLPLRRITTLKTAADELVCSESFAMIKAGEKIDPKMFAVPP